MSAARTLPQYAAPGLRLLSIGLNPSLPSVRAGYYFANPRNRFWRAFFASGLAPVRGEPSAALHRALLAAGVGFTDTARRATRGGAELRAADFRAGAAALLALLGECRPAWAWFHGKVAYRQFLRHARLEAPGAVDWGLQPGRVAGARVFVTPNPSPANAAHSLAEITGWYRRLAALAHA